MKKIGKIICSFLLTACLATSVAGQVALAATQPAIAQAGYSTAQNGDIYFSETSNPAGTSVADENAAQATSETEPVATALPESATSAVPPVASNPSSETATSTVSPVTSSPSSETESKVSSDTSQEEKDSSEASAEKEKLSLELDANVNLLAASTGVRGFVERLYNLVMSRPSDAEGIDYWTNQITSGEKTAAQVAFSFFNSPEFIKKPLNSEEYLTILYRTMMGREPDAAGIAYWEDFLAGGLSRNYVLYNFVVLPEFTNICQQYGVARGDFTLDEARDQNIELTRFLSRLYLNCMGRTADAGGLNYWAELLQNKKETGASVVAYFFTCDEFNAKKLNNEVFLRTAYHTLFGREADQGGFDFWMNIFKKGVSHKYILNQFIILEEFTNACQVAGIERSSLTLTEARDQNVDVTEVGMNVYRSLLGRDADVDGLNGLCTQLITNKQNAIDILFGFTLTPEFLSRNLNASDYVVAVFKALCGRAPTDAETATWASLLIADNASSRKEVFLLIANSQPCQAYLGAKLGISTFGNLERGIDVSDHQGAINWAQVAAAGYSFAIIRAVTTKGSTTPSVDPYFYQNVRGAKAAGLKVGVYIYSYARTDDYIQDEVNVGLGAIRAMEKEGYRFDYPIAMDMEEFSRHPSNTPADWTRLANLSLALIDQQGYYPCLYSFANALKSQFYMDQLKGYDLWVAHWTYNTNVTMGYPGAIWQYDNNGSVPGVSGRCDLNVSYKDFATVIRNAGKNHLR